MSRKEDKIELGGQRAPTDLELGVLQVLLGAEFRGRDALNRQLETVLVTVIDGDGSLRLHVGGGPLADVVRRVPVEAETADADGTIIHVLLHVVDGQLNELEIYREDSRPLQQELDPGSLRVIAF